MHTLVSAVIVDNAPDDEQVRREDTDRGNPHDLANERAHQAEDRSAGTRRAGHQHEALVVCPVSPQPQRRAVEPGEEHERGEDHRAEERKEGGLRRGCRDLHLHPDDEQPRRDHQRREYDARPPERSMQLYTSRMHERGLQRQQKIPPKEAPAVHMHRGRHGRIRPGNARAEVREPEAAEGREGEGDGGPQVVPVARHGNAGYMAQTSSFTIFAATMAVRPDSSRCGLSSTTSAPTT